MSWGGWIAVAAIFAALIGLVLYFQRRGVLADIQAENLERLIKQARENEKSNQAIERNAAATPAAAVKRLRKMRDTKPK